MFEAFPNFTLEMGDKSTILLSICGQLAQLAEHSFDVGVVRGSSPLLPTKNTGTVLLSGVFICLTLLHTCSICCMRDTIEQRELKKGDV